MTHRPHRLLTTTLLSQVNMTAHQPPTHTQHIANQWSAAMTDHNPVRLARLLGVQGYVALCKAYCALANAHLAFEEDNTDCCRSK